jgi:hypothetical protein
MLRYSREIEEKKVKKYRMVKGKKGRGEWKD